MNVRELAPTNVWNYFEDLNAVPRPSKKEEKVIAFMMNFGHSLQLETYKDHAGNVIIKKDATKGMEDRKVVILQSHLDMVHQKNADTNFDFLSQGIESYIDGEWVTGSGTKSTTFSSATKINSFTNVASTVNGVYHFIAGDDGGDQDIGGQANFGNPPFSISSGNSDANSYGNFEYPVPSGYYSLNTKNLAEFG